MTATPTITIGYRPLPADDVLLAAIHVDRHAGTLQRRALDAPTANQRVVAELTLAATKALADRLRTLAGRLGREARPSLTSGEQLACAERIRTAMPDLELSQGQALAVLAVVLDQLDELRPDPQAVPA